MKTANLFKGEEMTSGVKTEGTISLLYDEDKTVYYSPWGMDGIVTKMLTISNGCKFENEVYSFPLIGKQYESKKDAEKGITIEISNDEYKLVKE